MKKSLVASAMLGVTFFVSCAHVPYAREVKKRPAFGGVIALNTHHTPEDRMKADTIMRSNCVGKEVQVTDEGEVATGTRTQSSASSNYGQDSNSGFKLGGIAFSSSTPSQNTNVSSETTTMKEWQISYECVAKQDDAAAKPTAKKATNKKKS